MPVPCISDSVLIKDAAASYISKCTRTYDEESLRALEVRLEQLRGNPRATAGRIEKVLEAIRHTTPEIPDVKPAHGKVQWMSRVRVLVEKIIAPDSVDWMEDDASTSRNSYTTRALSDIQNRFERFVFCVYYLFQDVHILQQAFVSTPGAGARGISEGDQQSRMLSRPPRGRLRPRVHTEARIHNLDHLLTGP